METKERMKGFKTKRLLSILLTLCMVISLLPTLPVYADAPVTHGVTWVHLGDQMLDSEYKFLVGGEASKTGEWASSQCTARFDSETGILTLKNYDGGSIEVRSVVNYVSNDLTINLVGDKNKIKASGAGPQMGIWNASGGDINITATNASLGKLAIEVVSEDSYATAILGYGSINIDDYAEVLVDVSTSHSVVNRISYGLSASNGVNISNAAWLMVNMDGAETIGIATKKINIDTNSMNNKINSWGDSSDSLALKAETSVTIENADFHLVSTGSITNDDTKVTYDASKVVADDSITAVGEKKRTYRSGEIHTLTVNHGSGTGPHMVDDDLTITADARPNMRFVKWVVNSGDINFPLETPVTNPFVRITMPEGNAEMTAKYEELLVFNVMPKSATAVKYIDDFYASFSWTVADTGKSITAAEIQVKNGETWEHYWYLPESKRNPGLQTYGVGAELDTVGSKTYRLLYRVDGSDVYSDEFTITWEHSEVTGIIISPKTATLGKIDMIDFNAIITEIGHCDKTVTWSVTGGSDQTQINEYGLLDVDQTEEPETTLTVTATSYDGKTASAIVLRDRLFCSRLDKMRFREKLTSA